MPGSRHYVGLALATMAPRRSSTTAASAGPPFKETIHDERDVRPRGLLRRRGAERARSTRVVDIRVHINAARAGSPRQYFLQHGTMDRGAHECGQRQVVDDRVARVIEKDMRVTDNGDGTRDRPRSSQPATPCSTARTGRRSPGTRARLGSSSSSTRAVRRSLDDVSRRVVRESTGRSDDFCTAAVAALS